MNNDQTWLKQGRLQLNLSQSEVAEALGITRPTYIRYEKSPDSLSITQLRAIQNLGIKLENITLPYEAKDCPTCNGSGLVYVAVAP